MKTKTPNGIWVLLLPPLFLFILGLALFRRSQMIATSKSSPSTFSAFVPVIKEIKITPESADNVGFAAYHVVVFIGHRGPRPVWWGKEDGRLLPQNSKPLIHAENGPDLEDPQFVNKSTKYKWHIWGGTPSLYDVARQQYYVDYHTEIDKEFNVPQSDFVGTINMIGKKLKFSEPVRRVLH